VHTRASLTSNLAGGALSSREGNYTNKPALTYTGSGGAGTLRGSESQSASRVQ
jgi:hypothetical protein